MSRMGAAALSGLVCTLLVGTAGLGAIYAPVETRRVPVERLVANLERKLAEDPQNVQAWINLARLHGMAYAVKSDEASALIGPGGKEEAPWYGHESWYIPYRNQSAPSVEAAAKAQQHLKKAIEYYEGALKLHPDNLLATLGYGWMLDQAGEKPRAIEQYRKVIARAWPSERDSRVTGPGRRFFTEEAIEYMLPLLDPRADAAEVRDLRAKKEAFERRPRAITPIAIPIARHVTQADIHDSRAHVRFDADGSGLRREWTWINPDAGWLVHDADGQGAITSALQLFGNVTFWLFWENGYQALAALDDDNDGEIAGSERQHLGIWRDANRNGISEAGEVTSLSAHGIVALNCRYEEGDGVTFAAISREGVRLSDGRTRPTYDVILRASSRTLTLLRQP